MIKGIAFDAGGVLLITKEIDSEEEYLLRKYFPNICYREYKESFRRFNEKAQTIKGYSLKRALTECLKSLGVKNKKKIEYFTCRISKLRPEIVDGCKELFDYLKSKGIKIIVLSDTHHTSLSAKRALNSIDNKISRMIDFIITSKDLGCKKPCFEIFKQLFKKTELNKEEILFITDSEEELLGARDSGIRTLFFSNEKEKSLIYLKSKIEKYL